MIPAAHSSTADTSRLESGVLGRGVSRLSHLRRYREIVAVHALHLTSHFAPGQRLLASKTADAHPDLTRRGGLDDRADVLVGSRCRHTVFTFDCPSRAAPLDEV
jgi:hypothetical protein